MARVKVRLPGSDHHEWDPRPRPRVCRLAQTHKGSATGSLAEQLRGAIAGRVDLVEDDHRRTKGHGSPSSRAFGSTWLVIPRSTGAAARPS